MKDQISNEKFKRYAHHTTSNLKLLLKVAMKDRSKYGEEINQLVVELKRRLHAKNFRTFLENLGL